MQPFETIMTILTIASVGVLFVVAEPMIIVKRLLGFKEENIGIKKDYKLIGLMYLELRDFLTKLLYCALCSTWWISIIITHDVLLSSLIAIVAELIHRKINK